MEAPALVFIGFMGAGKTSAARAAASSFGARAVDADHEIEHRLGMPIHELLGVERRGGVPGGRGAGGVRAARAPAGAGAVARRRRGRLGARARAAAAPHGGAARRRRRRPPGTGPATSAGRWHATASGSSRCTRGARRSTRRSPTRSCSTPRATRCGGRRPALRSIPPGAKLLWASTASGSYPVHVGKGSLGSGFWPVERAALRDHRRVGRRAVPRSRRRRRRSRSRPASSTRRWRPSSGCCASWRRPGWTTTTTWRARRRGGRRRRRLLRRRLPARGEGRAGADHARRPGRLGVRRQDRRRPPRGQELRRRLPPARRRAGRPGDDGDAPAGRAGGRLGRGDQDRADRRRAAVGARARRRRARP